jgi:K+-sensing histidine kinase KdpD
VILVSRSEILFEPFYTTAPEGIGMGLSIGRTIIEAHSGQLWAIPVRAVGCPLLPSFSLRSPQTELPFVIDIAYWHKADLVFAGMNVRS